MKQIPKYLLPIGMLGLLVACGGNGAESGASGDEGNSNAEEGQLEDLTLRNNIYYTGVTLPYIAGIQEGIYEDHGINLEVVEGTGSSTTVQTVANGSDDIGLADGGTLVQNRAQGVQATMIAAMMPTSPQAILALEESGIEEPEDLEGRIAGYTPGSATEVLFPAFAESTGIDETSVEFRNVDIPTRNQLFASGDTDFTFGALNTSVPNFENQIPDGNINTIPYADHGINTVSTGIIAGPEIVENRPETLESFLEATLEAVEYTNENTEQAVDQFFDYAPDSQLEPEVVQRHWETTMELSASDRTEGLPYGCTVTEQWEETIQLMEDFADAQEGAVAADEVYTDEFHPEGCAG